MQECFEFDEMEKCGNEELEKRGIDEGGRKRCKTDESNEENELIGNVMIRVCDTKMRDRKQRNA